MNIISHRGFWLNKEEKNSIEAFRRSFELCFGTETDVRDLNGSLVISHDPPKGGEMPLLDFLQLVKDKTLPLAINIKSDGLAKDVARIFTEAGHRSWFVFDMSVPDMRSYLTQGVAVYARVSEVEQTPAFLDSVCGIWLDGFESVWYDCDLIEHYVAMGKDVCVVSAELHGRDHVAQWEMLKPLSANSRITLCTDFPDQAKNFFGGAT